MKKGNTISIIIMVVIVIVAALAFFTLQQSQVEPTKVYVWAVDAHETKVITIEDVVEKTIPADAVTEDMIKVNDKVNMNGNVVSALEAYVLGKMVNTAVYSGEYVTANALVTKEDIDPFKLMDLSGYRKYAMGTGTIQAVGGNIEAGDVIDLIITVQGQGTDEEGEPINWTYTKIFMENVLVYKVLTGSGDDYIDHIEHEDAAYTTPSTLILAVTPAQLEEIKSRESIGTISFIGRFDDSVDAESNGFTVEIGNDGIEFIPDNSYEIQY